MSNKPLKLRQKGSPIPPPLAAPTHSRASPQKSAGRLIVALRGKKAVTQATLSLCLLLLCACYVMGLNQNATAVVATKRELPIYCVERDDKKLSISFDASWGADKTIPILDILDKYKVKTTFFLVGNWVEKYPDMVKEIFARGHEIGNHSDSHAHMPKLSEQAIRDDLHTMSDRVESLTGVRPTLFRPPYGDYNNRVIEVTRAEGYEAVQWSIDSRDWMDRGTADIIKQCTSRVENGDIVLFHNDSNDILNALPTVIEHYQSLGFEIIPVSQLLLTGETSIDVQGKQHPKQTTEPKQ